MNNVFLSHKISSSVGQKNYYCRFPTFNLGDKHVSVMDRISIFSFFFSGFCYFLGFNPPALLKSKLPFPLCNIISHFYLFAYLFIYRVSVFSQLSVPEVLFFLHSFVSIHSMLLMPYKLNDRDTLSQHKPSLSAISGSRNT